MWCKKSTNKQIVLKNILWFYIILNEIPTLILIVKETHWLHFKL